MTTQQLWIEIKRAFPGRSNAGLRNRVWNLSLDVLDGKAPSLLGLRRSIAFTALGDTALARLDKMVQRTRRA